MQAMPNDFFLSPREITPPPPVAAMNGTTDDTAAFAAAIAQARSTDKVLWIDRPLFMADPMMITVPADVTIQFVGDGALLWRFGTVREARIRRRGAFTATPTITVDQAGVTVTETYRLLRVTLSAPGSGYAPDGTLTLSGGTFTTAAQVEVLTTRIVGAVGIVSPGSGYPDGTRPFRIEGGEGRKAELTCQISGGAVVSATLTYAGSYTENPPATAAAERLDGETGAGLEVGPLGFGAETVAVVTPGTYTAITGALTAPGGAGFSAVFELGTVTGSGGPGLVNEPVVTVGSDAGAIVLTGDRPTFDGPLIGDLTSRFTGAYQAFKGTPRSTRLRPLAAGSPQRDLDGRLRETVSVKDFGAIGDGRERGADEHPLYTAIVGDAPAYGFVTASPASADKLRLIEASDTLDWLAFELAIRHLAGLGGGTLLVPGGHYVTRRHINLADGIEIRGESRHTTVIDNVWETGVGYLGDFRPMAFSIGVYHPAALNVDNANRLVRYNAIAAIEPGSSRVRVSATDAARFMAGDFLMLGSIRFDVIGGHEHPVFAQINRVRAIDGQDLVCERPFKRLYTDNGTAKARVRRFGTGRDGSSGLGDTPWQVRADVTIRDLATRGRSLTQRNAAWNLRIENVGHRGRNGLVHNAFVHSRVRRLSIVTEERGIETKGESFDVVFEDVAIVFLSAVKHAAVPLLSVGESTEDAVYRRVTVEDGLNFGQLPTHSTAQVARVRLAAWDTVLDDVTVTCREPGAQALLVITEHGGERSRVERLRLVSVGGALNVFARVASFEAQAFPLVQARDVTLVGTTAAADPFRLEQAQEGSYVEDFSATEPAYAPSGGGLSSTSIVKSERRFTRSDVRNAILRPNASGEGVGDRVLLDSGAAVFADGPGQFDTWSYVPKVDGEGGTVAIQPGRTLRNKDQLATFKWNAAGSDVYYVSANPSGNPGINGGVKPAKVFVGDKKELVNNDTVATLAAGQWAWAKPSGVNWFTVYMILPSDTTLFPARDPDAAVYRDAIVRFVP
jgi:hypothetical protein